jgi:hypothetical protein
MKTEKTNITRIKEIFETTGWPIPKEEKDYSEKRYDYRDMIAFASMCGDILSQEVDDCTRQQRENYQNCADWQRQDKGCDGCIKTYSMTEC